MPPRGTYAFFNLAHRKEVIKMSASMAGEIEGFAFPLSVMKPDFINLIKPKTKERTMETTVETVENFQKNEEEGVTATFNTNLPINLNLSEHFGIVKMAILMDGLKKIMSIEQGAISSIMAENPDANEKAVERVITRMGALKVIEMHREAIHQAMWEGIYEQFNLDPKGSYTMASEGADITIDYDDTPDERE